MGPPVATFPRQTRIFFFHSCNGITTRFYHGEIGIQNPDREAHDDNASGTPPAHRSRIKKPRRAEVAVSTHWQSAIQGLRQSRKHQTHPKNRNARAGLLDSFRTLAGIQRERCASSPAHEMMWGDGHDRPRRAKPTKDGKASPHPEATPIPIRQT